MSVLEAQASTCCVKNLYQKSIRNEHETKIRITAQVSKKLLKNEDDEEEQLQQNKHGEGNILETNRNGSVNTPNTSLFAKQTAGNVKSIKDNWSVDGGDEVGNIRYLGYTISIKTYL